MPYAYAQLVARYDEVGAQLPRGTSSFGVDSEAGVLLLVVQPEHDAVVVRSLLDPLPADAVTVRSWDERWYADQRGEPDNP